METWVYKNAGKLFAWHRFFWQHDRELSTVVHARCIHISRAPRNTSGNFPTVTYLSDTLFFHVLYIVHVQCGTMKERKEFKDIDNSHMKTIQLRMPS